MTHLVYQMRARARREQPEARGPWGTAAVLAILMLSLASPSAAQGDPTGPNTDLSVTIADSPDPAVVNQNLTYTLTVANAGPNDSGGVLVLVFVSPNLTFVTHSNPEPYCYQYQAGRWDCWFSGVAVGQQVTGNLVMRPTAAGTFLTSVEATSEDTWDLNFGNNTNATSTTVLSAAPAKPNAAFTFTPASPAVGASVQFTDQSSAGAAYTRAWDRNGDGQTDSTLANPTYAFAGPGTYTARLTASNAFGSSTTTRTVTVAASAPSGTPIITSVPRTYPGVFLRGSGLGNTFQANVNWGGSPGTVSFSVNGGPPAVELGTSSGAWHLFDMDTAFPARLDASVVTVVATNGQGIKSAPWRESVHVFPYPEWLTLAANYGVLSFSAGGGEMKAAVQFDYPTPHIAANGPLQIPTWVPFVGGSFGLTETYASAKGSMSSHGTASFSLYGQSGFVAMGQLLQGSLRGTGNLLFSPPGGLVLSSASMQVNVRGTIKKTWGLLDAIPPLGTLATNTPPLRPAINWLNQHASIEGSVSPSLELTANFAQNSAGQLRFSNGTGQIGLELRATLKLKVIDNHLSAKAWAAGSGSITLGVPQPYLRGAQMGFETGVSFEVDALFLSCEAEAKYQVGCSWSATSPDLNVTCNAGAGSPSAGCSFSLGQPQYARFGKASVFKPRRLRTRSRSRASASSVATSLVTNTFPGASPRLVEVAGGGRLLLWVSQHPGLPVLRSTGISWSLHDGSTWTTPGFVVADTQTELQPVAGVDASGRVVAAWLRIKDPAFATPIQDLGDLPLFYTRMEVVSAVFDPSTQAWSAVTALTDDVGADTNLRLSADTSGNLLLTWLTNPNAEFVSTPTYPSTLNFSVWNGSAWTAPSPVATGLEGVASHEAALHDGSAVVLVPRDPDPDVVGDGVIDAYSWNGSSWSGPTAFAAGSGDHRRPSVVYDASGEAHVVWMVDADLVHATLSAPTPELVRPGSNSLGLYGAQLFVNAPGNLTLVWLQPGSEGPAQIFARLFDPTSATWSEDVQLADESTEARDVAGFYSAAGELRLAYLATDILRSTTTVPIDGTPTVITNIPEDGQTDLRLLDHSLARNLSVRNDDLTLTPPRPAPGEDATAHLTVHNNGDFPIDAFTVELHVGEGPGAVLVGSADVTDPLPAGASTVLDFPFVFPVSGGNVVASVDTQDSVAEASETDNVALFHLDNTPPTARLTASATKGSAPMIVTLDASSSSDDDDDPLQFSWSFGDGTVGSAGPQVTHQFSRSGTHPVTVVARDPSGDMDSATVLVTVQGGPLLKLSKAAVSASEAKGKATFTVTRLGSLTDTVSVDYSTSAGTATPGQDYTETLGTLTFGPKVKSLSIVVPIANDTQNEPRETVLLGLRNAQPEGVLVGEPSVGLLTITDDDAAGRIQFSAASYASSETAGTVRIPVTRVGGVAGSVSVDFQTGDGSAQAGSDFVYTVASVSFDASGTGATTQYIDIPILPDATSEGPETFTVTLSGPTGGSTLRAPATTTVTIQDDEPAFALSTPAYSAQEKLQKAVVEVTRSGPSTTTATVDFALSPVTATPGTDYTHLSGVLTFVPGKTSLLITVPIVNDGLYEGPEDLMVTLSNPSPGMTLGAPDASVITIVDDELVPTLQFSLVSYSVGEAAGQALVAVKRTGNLLASVTVEYDLSAGTATGGGVDFSLAFGSLNFPPGVAVQTIAIPITNDLLSEGTETVGLILQNPGGGAVLGPVAASVLSIVDDETTVQWSKGAYSAAELPKSLTLTVKRTGNLTLPSTVDYAVIGGTATNGLDYVLAPGTLAFAANQSTASLPVQILGDGLAEGNETVEITLANATNALPAAPSVAVVTIQDNDTAGMVRLGAGVFSGGEGTAGVVINVTRTGTAGPAMVDYATTDGTAAAGTDYVETSGTLVFSPGEKKKTITIAVLADDEETVAARSLLLSLTNPQGGLVLGTPATATVWIAKR